MDEVTAILHLGMCARKSFLLEKFLRHSKHVWGSTTLVWVMVCSTMPSLSLYAVSHVEHQ